MCAGEGVCHRDKGVRKSEKDRQIKRQTDRHKETKPERIRKNQKETERESVCTQKWKGKHR